MSNTNNNAQENEALNKQLEVASKQVADARTARESGQKTLDELTAASAKSMALATAAEADVGRMKASLETAQKSLQASKEAAAQLEAAKIAAAEMGKKETEALQGIVPQASAALAAANTEKTDLQTKLEKTEKFSDAFKQATSRVEAANKQIVAVRALAEQDGKKVADLQAALEKIAGSVGASDAEAGKAMATLAASDANYQRYQEIEKQLDSANQKIAEAKVAAAKTGQDLDAANSAVAQIKLAQAHAALLKGRDALTAQQLEHDKLPVAVAAAGDEHAKIAKGLAEAQATLAAFPAQIKTFEAEVQKTTQAMNEARAALKQAGLAAAENPENEAAPALLTEKQKILRTATNEVQVAQTALAAAQTKSVELTAQVKSLAELANNSAAKLQAAKAAEAESAQRLAVEKERVEKLATEYQRLKPASPAIATQTAGS